MMEKVYQGEINLDGSTSIDAIDTTIIINKIIINNLSSDYYLILYRKSADSPNNIVPIYKFNLDLGDTVRDTENYILNPGDSLIFVTNVIKTTYYVKAEEI
jgi:hypothetical protein